MLNSKDRTLSRNEVISRRRRDILQVALAVFADKGYQTTEMDDIAARSKISPAALSRYFSSKADIFMALVDGMVGEIQAIANEKAYKRSANKMQYYAAMQEIGLRYSFVFVKRPALVKLFFEEACAEPEIKSKTEATLEVFLIATEDFLLHGVQKRLIKIKDTRSTARLINAMIFDTLRTFASGSLNPQEQVLLVNSMVDFISRGLGL